MQEFGFIRHGHKLNARESKLPLEESGLSPIQQEKWEEAVNRLGIKDDPQMGYENLPLIEQMAKDMYESLPEKATVVFSSTAYPRTRLTADLISTELVRLTAENKTKEIGVSFLWEPLDEAVKEDSMTNVGDMHRESATNQRLMREVKERDYPGDVELEEYLEQQGRKTYANEDEVLRRAVNLDLESSDSQYRKRVSTFREQLKNIESTFDEGDGPIFFYMVGHHPNLITFDVAINGRDHYDRSDEIPKPLTLWKADREKIRDFINQES